MSDELNSVEDIDTMLDSEFNITDDNDVDNEKTNGDENNQSIETDTKTSTNDGVTDDEDDDDSQNDDESSSNGTTEQNDDDISKTNEGQEKPNKDAKKEYAFAQLRKENASLKETLKAKTSSDEMLKRIAAQYGYDDVNKFTKDYEDARVIQEAKNKGYDPVLYKELQDSKRRIAELEKTNEQATLMTRAGAFKNAVEKAVTDYNLGEDGRQEIFTKLEEAGYTVATILSLPNPEIVIKGILSDKIAEVSKQKQLEKLETLDNLADDKHNGASSTKNISLDDLINQEMKEYKAKNFYN